MNIKTNPNWIPLSRIESMLGMEPALALVALAFLSWLVYRILLRKVSIERHRNMRKLFMNMLAHLVVFGVLFGMYSAVQNSLDTGIAANNRLASYLGLGILVSGAIVFVKVSRILMFEYLFLGHMRAGVPLLIVNLFALLLSIGIAGWFATEIFGVRLGPVLATSAVFSLILGLALQDTLGNLFAGVALQLDKPYEIGDWVEVAQSGTKYVGQVEEISWRATTMIGLFDELLILPNRLMAMAEISNFTTRKTPIWRSQSFRIPYTADLNLAKEVIAGSIRNVEGVRRTPAPVAWIAETSESWLVFRCSYSIDQYIAQFQIGSHVITAVVEGLREAGFTAAANRVQVVADEGAPSPSL